MLEFDLPHVGVSSKTLGGAVRHLVAGDVNMEANLVLFQGAPPSLSAKFEGYGHYFFLGFIS